MSEPIYIAQTFETEHLVDPVAARAWFAARGVEAHDRGATYPRMTVNDDQTGLLFEAWTEKPKDQGDPRWAFAAEIS